MQPQRATPHRDDLRDILMEAGLPVGLGAEHLLECLEAMLCSRS